MLLLVRHGEATANAAGVLVGRSDPPLTERGREQAAALGRLLGPVVRVISSPLGRTLATAAALDAGVRIEVDERWIEVDYGEHEGRPVGDVAPDDWHRWRTDPTFRHPGGESLAEVGLRVRAACEELFATDGTGARDPAGHAVVVSHVSPIKAAVAWALGAGDALAARLYLGTGSLSTVSWGAGAPVLRSYNVPSLPER